MFLRLKDFMGLEKGEFKIFLGLRPKPHWGGGEGYSAATQKKQLLLSRLRRLRPLRCSPTFTCFAQWSLTQA